MKIYALIFKIGIVERYALIKAETALQAEEIFTTTYNDIEVVNITEVEFDTDNICVLWNNVN